MQYDLQVGATIDLGMGHTVIYHGLENPDGTVYGHFEFSPPLDPVERTRLAVMTQELEGKPQLRHSDIENSSHVWLPFKPDLVNGRRDIIDGKRTALAQRFGNDYGEWASERYRMQEAKAAQAALDAREAAEAEERQTADVLFLPERQSVATATITTHVRSTVPATRAPRSEARRFRDIANDRLRQHDQQRISKAKNKR